MTPTASSACRSKMGRSRGFRAIFSRQTGGTQPNFLRNAPEGPNLVVSTLETPQSRQNENMTNGQDSLAEAIAGLVNDYSKEERRFGHSPTSRQTPGGRDSLPALVDVEGAHHTGMLAVPQWEGSVVGVEHQQLVDNDVRDQKRALISRIQHRSLARLPSVSVIIPALGCKLWVLECVDAISRQSVFSEEIRNTCDVACEII